MTDAKHKKTAIDVSNLETLAAFEEHCQTLGLFAEASPDSTINPLGFVPTQASDVTFQGGSALPVRLDTLPTLKLQQAGEETTGTKRLEERDYRIVGVLGEGGMGLVQEATQMALQRNVALKRLKPERASAREVHALLQEALLMGHLEHPNIVPVHALGCDEQGAPLLVMKRIDGIRWRDVLRDPNHPVWTEVQSDRLVWHIEQLLQVCHALEFAHSKGIIHRDIKPENVMIGDFGEVYLLDWGIGLKLDEHRASASRDIAGTPSYMAPEMLQGDALTEATDVYLLGATLHEVLTGAPPHQGDGLFEVMYAVLHPKLYPYAEDLPAELIAICRRAMAFAPTERFADVKSFRVALLDFLQHRSANQLIHAASARLDELKHLLRDPQALPAPQDVHPLFYECRFALEQAEQSWPANEDLQALRQECLTLGFSYELTQRNASAAQALYAELAAPQAAQKQELDALLASIASEREAAEKMRALEVDMDASVASQERSWLAILLIFCMLMVAGLYLWTRFVKGSKFLSYERTVAMSSVLYTVVCSAIFFGRRRFLKNKFSRHVSYSILIVTTAVLFNRIRGMIFGVPLSVTLGNDGLIIGFFCLLGSFTIHRYYVYPAVVGISSLVLALFLPQMAVNIVAMILVFGLALYATLGRTLLRKRREEAPGEDGLTPPP